MSVERYFSFSCLNCRLSDLYLHEERNIVPDEVSRFQKPISYVNDCYTPMRSSQDTPLHNPLGASEVAQLLIKHRPRLMAYLVSCVRNYVDAEDLFQDVSVAAIGSAGDLRSADQFIPWALEIARRRVLTHFRKSKRLTPVDPELATRLAETATMLNQASEVPDRIEALHDCLESLPLESRKLVALRYEDLRRPVETIAPEFGRSVQATYAILKRTRMILRDCVTRKLSEVS